MYWSIDLCRNQYQSGKIWIVISLLLEASCRKFCKLKTPGDPHTFVSLLPAALPVFHSEDQRKTRWGSRWEGNWFWNTSVCSIISDKACPQKKMFYHRPNLLGFCQSLTDLWEGNTQLQHLSAILTPMRHGEKIRGTCEALHETET